MKYPVLRILLALAGSLASLALSPVAESRSVSSSNDTLDGCDHHVLRPADQLTQSAVKSSTFTVGYTSDGLRLNNPYIQKYMDAAQRFMDGWEDQW